MIDSDSPPARLRVLVIDDEAAVCDVLVRFLRGWGHAAMEARSLRRARELMETEQFDAITCDGNLGDGSGVDFIRELRDAQNHIPVVFISGAMTPEFWPDEYLKVLPKPFEFSVLRALLHALAREPLPAGLAE